VSPERFEPALSASELPQTHALDRTAPGNAFVIIVGEDFVFPLDVRLCPVFSVSRRVASVFILAAKLKSGAVSVFLRRCKRMISIQLQMSLKWRKISVGYLVTKWKALWFFCCCCWLILISWDEVGKSPRCSSGGALQTSWVCMVLWPSYPDDCWMGTSSSQCMLIRVFFALRFITHIWRNCIIFVPPVTTCSRSMKATVEKLQLFF